MLDSEAARLIKRPARLEDATRACREPNSDAPLNRRAYVILCLALASLVRADRQTTLVRLRDSIVGLVHAEPRFAAEAFALNWSIRKLAVTLSMLSGCWFGGFWEERKQGEEERFIKDAEADALYRRSSPGLGAAARR